MTDIYALGKGEEKVYMHTHVKAVEGLDRVYQNNVSNKNIYVDQNFVGGNETGEVNHPFKTINQAINSIAYFNVRDIFINVAAGDYDETVIIKGIQGSSVQIIGQGSPRVKTIVYYDSFGYSLIKGFDFTKYAPEKNHIRFSRCGYGGVRDCKFGNTSDAALIEWDGSQGSINSTTFNGSKIATSVLNGSSVRFDDANAMINCNVGILIQSAIARLSGSGGFLKGAIKQVEFDQGGRLFKESSIFVPQLQNNWTEYRTDYPFFVEKDTDGFVHLNGLIKDGTVGTGIAAFTLPTGLSPIAKKIFFLGDGTKIAIDTQKVVVEKSTGSYVSLDGISFKSDLNNFVF